MAYKDFSDEKKKILLDKLVLWRKNNPEKMKAAKKRYAERNPEKVRQWRKNWKFRNPEKYKQSIQKHYELTKSNRIKYPEKYEQEKRRSTLIKYGLTEESYKALLNYQNNKCAVCGDVFQKTAYVDHDHATGRVRGLLCQFCNTGIGCFKDSEERLLNAIEYLKKQKVQVVMKDLRIDSKPDHNTL